MSSPENVLLPDGRRIGDLKVADLRTQLEIRGLSRSGVKKDLCARLSDAVDTELQQTKMEATAAPQPVASNGSSETNTQNEDALEIDAVASDEEITELSAPNEISITVEHDISKSEESVCKSTPTPASASPSPSPSPSSECTTQNSEMTTPAAAVLAVAPNVDDAPENVGTTVDQPISTAVKDSKPEIEIQPQRRRQWGSRSIPSTPSLSSESLEKLIPPSACPGGVGWVRSKSLIVTNNENETDVSSDSTALQDMLKPSLDIHNENSTTTTTTIDINIEEAGNDKLYHTIDDDKVNICDDNDQDKDKDNLSSINHNEMNKMPTATTPPPPTTTTSTSTDINKTSVQLEREVELEVDAVVESMDTDDALNDSRTVHLSTDISPKLDVIIKRTSGGSGASAGGVSSMGKQSSTDRKVITAKTTTTTTTTSTAAAPLTSSSSRVGQSSTLTSSSSSTVKKTSSSPSKRKGPKETKAVGYLVEPPERIEPVQPAKHPQTDIVYIRFLVRPFTAEQLRQMVTTHYGPVVDLWLDKIKSSSLIRLQTVEYAEKCREGLDGSRWPSMNPRVLRCDYASIDLFEWMKVNGDTSDAVPPKHLLLGETSTSSVAESQTVKVSEEKSGGSSELQRDGKPADLRRKLERANRDLEAPNTAAIMMKSRQNESKDALPPAPTPPSLTDTKPKTTPSIYWLPLTAEQVNQRTKKVAVEKSSSSSGVKNVSSRNSSSHHLSSEESGPRATRSPFTNTTAITTAAPLPPTSTTSGGGQSSLHKTAVKTGSKVSNERRLPTATATTKSNETVKQTTAAIKKSTQSHASSSTSVTAAANNNNKHSTVPSDSKLLKSRNTSDMKSGHRVDIADKQISQLSKSDVQSNTSSSLIKMDDNRRKESSSPTRAQKRPSKTITTSDDKEIVPSKQSRSNVTSSSSGDSSVVGGALAAYKRNHVGSQPEHHEHRSEHRRRSSSGRGRSPSYRKTTATATSYKSYRPENMRIRDKLSHSRGGGGERYRSRSTDRRYRSRSIDRRSRSRSPIVSRRNRSRSTSGGRGRGGSRRNRSRSYGRRDRSSSYRYRSRR
uniref:SAP domain-containing protein n=1 Tax=Trichobilharzia regenti TaxID=157069 RepID=A0AA85IYL1_TRIRE|nr:unnamed protein product [Trichobilharzia regenti]